jgi:hypothetical protein
MSLMRLTLVLEEEKEGEEVVVRAAVRVIDWH